MSGGEIFVFAKVKDSQTTHYLAYKINNPSVSRITKGIISLGNRPSQQAVNLIMAPRVGLFSNYRGTSSEAIGRRLVTDVQSILSAHASSNTAAQQPAPTSAPNTGTPVTPTPAATPAPATGTTPTAPTSTSTPAATPTLPAVSAKKSNTSTITHDAKHQTLKPFTNPPKLSQKQGGNNSWISEANGLLNN